jgi:glycerol-3-phosphate acyltransferase PlsY
MSEQLIQIIVVFLAYFLGSIPFGLVFTRLAGQGDIRQTGSGNIGATNVLRTGSKALALATLLADTAKGFIAVELAWHLAGHEIAAVSALACFIGHVFPVWLGFKGGKGVAVFIGAVLMLSPLTGLAFLAVWLITAIVLRRSSLAAIVALVLTPVLLLLQGETTNAQVSVVIVLIALWAHRANIARLRDGTEPKIGQ